MKRLLPYFVLLCLVLPALPAGAEEGAVAKKPVITATVSAGFSKTPDAVVAELFTSQGCSSCPPAQDVQQELSRRPEIITLEYHVDYWDNLKTWRGGTWKDTFSDSAWTQRQVDYNRRIMNSEQGFTPETVIDGRFQDVGSKKSNILTLLDEAAALRRVHYSVSPHLTPDGNMTVTVNGPGIKKEARVVLLRLIKEAAIDVKGGENKGTTMRGHNIVTALMVIGTWVGGKEDYKFALPSFKDNESCAVLLQDPETLHILGAGLCSM
ncbi:MAG: DUF1223 domain-containing protein [Micavibrio sp.]|nr:DUF1223 domain-containing protein [Micavibrio sp.]